MTRNKKIKIGLEIIELRKQLLTLEQCYAKLELNHRKYMEIREELVVQNYNVAFLDCNVRMYKGVPTALTDEFKIAQVAKYNDFIRQGNTRAAWDSDPDKVFSVKRIRAWCRQYNIPPAKPLTKAKLLLQDKTNVANILKIYTDYIKQGYSVEEIVRELNIPRTLLKEVLDYHGVSMPPPREILCHPEKIEKVLLFNALVEQGVTQQSALKQIDASYKGILSYSDTTNIPLWDKKSNILKMQKELLEKAAELTKQGYSIAQAAKSVNVSDKALRCWSQRENIPLISAKKHRTNAEKINIIDVANKFIHQGYTKKKAVQLACNELGTAQVNERLLSQWARLLKHPLYTQVITPIKFTQEQYLHFGELAYIMYTTTETTYSQVGAKLNLTVPRIHACIQRYLSENPNVPRIEDVIAARRLAHNINLGSQMYMLLIQGKTVPQINKLLKSTYRQDRILHLVNAFCAQVSSNTEDATAEKRD